MSEFDERSEKNLATLRPKAQPRFRAMLRKFKEYAAKNGLEVKIISANRTWAEQDALFKKRPKVTNARGGQSNHNYQIAVDIGLFKGNDYLEDSPHYRKLGPIGESVGLAWGGRWKGFPDTPHYEIATGKKVSQLKAIVQGQGWKGIDAIIPEFKEEAPVPQPPAESETPKSEVVTILEKGVDGKVMTHDIKAYFVDSRVYVAIRGWSEIFGGDIELIGGKWRLILNGERSVVVEKTIDGTSYAKFADINAVLGWQYVFDGASSPKTLTILNDSVA